MTNAEWRETLAWAKDRFWATLEIRPGMAEAVYDRLSYFPVEVIRRGIQEYAFEHSGERYPKDSLWKHVERRGRDLRRAVPDSEVENEHGHTGAVRANISREMKRRRENSTDPDISHWSDEQAYHCFLVINRRITCDEYPGYRYGDRRRLNPDGVGQAPGPFTVPRSLRMKKLEPEPAKTVFDFVKQATQKGE